MMQAGLKACGAHVDRFYRKPLQQRSAALQIFVRQYPSQSSQTQGDDLVKKSMEQKRAQTALLWNAGRRWSHRPAANGMQRHEPRDTCNICVAP